tara:strand:+ start:441 stop:689 length:249 start_codon:yes stop_codon:yes gene_type:complete
MTTEEAIALLPDSGSVAGLLEIDGIKSRVHWPHSAAVDIVSNYPCAKAPKDLADTGYGIVAGTEDRKAYLTTKEVTHALSGT